MTGAENTPIFDLAVSNLDFDQACARIDQRIESREPGYIFTPNVNHVCICHRDAVFRAAYASAFLCLADGMPIIWASRLLGVPLKNKLSGSDMVPLLAAHAARAGHSVYFLGGSEGAAQETADRLQTEHPGLRVAGVDCPPMGFHQDDVLERAVIDRVQAATPDLLFVALGSPKQELWIARHTQELGVPVSMGVGAAFDFYAGFIQRAPIWMQRCGLEWLWRVLCEPRRLWRRYLVEDVVFFRLLWHEYRRTRQLRIQENAHKRES